MICMSILLAPVPLGLWRFYACRRCNRGRCARCTMRSRPWNNHARRLRARGAAGKWQQSDVARPLDGHAQPALVPRADAGHPARQNLAALLHELRKDIRAFVVDEVHLLDAELAHLLLAEILALAARPPARAAGTTSTRPAFAARTTVPPMATTAFTPRSSTWR